MAQERMLMNGAEAIAEAAIRAGWRFFFGYPITPQNEIPEYMSARLPQVGGMFVQAESEVAASNMLYGASGAGVRVFTSSSSPGISLMMEAMSYIAGSELPVVVVNIMRGGPGLGGILPSQSDYFQATRGGGHGDYRLLVLAPSTVQEAVDLTMLAFGLAEKYRNPVMILADGFMGQMMEAVEFKETHMDGLPDPAEWAVGYMKQRGRRALIKSLYLDPEELEAHNWKLQAKYAEMTKNEKRHETYLFEDAEILIAAYGTVARIARTAINELRSEGLKVGLFRPISLFPFPYDPLEALPKSVKQILTVEMSCGQMVEDIRLAVGKEMPVSVYGRVGGMTPSVEEIKDQVRKALGR